ncbi:hypothetical protein NCER_100144 [Vairimorpha ceranae BRL01]|uniref:Protein AF-9 homolog n=2 Tax=Vairimorpha ceranae TaxID=40302 RepID=C4V6U8_VAIC1|nr:transcription initiation factor iif auxiliary subunit [Vairimorpha ceranae]EEQ83056.1 hypothetical protein NCER_100144 [Vairimorpha ceranae BRL01]KAF5140243.1 hypothetical protein G9O61_00g016300 [Vairimorpha ceranae]KKO75087.1 transcription initiation factor iif auxiliary subunit [Vairimorpha ceranae]
MKGYTSCRIVIGTIATKINIPNSDITHEWKVYVKAPLNIIKSVHYKLHESFPNNLIITEYPFEHIDRGWGEFTIQVKLILFNDDRLTTSHFLKLYGDSDPVINETVDEIIYKGMGQEIIPSVEENEEYKKIDEAIDFVLKLFDEKD